MIRPSINICHAKTYDLVHQYTCITTTQNESCIIISTLQTVTMIKATILKTEQNKKLLKQNSVMAKGMP